MRVNVPAIYQLVTAYAVVAAALLGVGCGGSSYADASAPVCPPGVDETTARPFSTGMACASGGSDICSMRFAPYANHRDLRTTCAVGGCYLADACDTSVTPEACTCGGGPACYDSVCVVPPGGGTARCEPLCNPAGDP